MTRFKGVKHVIRQQTRKERCRELALQNNYGISSNDYDDLFQKQGGVCAICGKPPIGKPLFVDHNHTTNCVRGLLCSGCNTHIWPLEDENFAWRLQAELYLTKHDGANNAPIQSGGNLRKHYTSAQDT